ncbi:DUF2269 domain-containing protein [Phytoactinopolyspora halotolerans]|uniref:DUF2269 domain-containing protein n=1 Tax=Phytoactinopolyspora halotolerans TaxID=1981512 RepID=A0A6L9S582_9ACTN|nr:DUF2269 domain-containing protein [Phytoactinopolyspora halotolerans]NED99900.1 DUF2269 domain-containing protein [Phytoactinopolyspora halotolerans]
MRLSRNVRKLMLFVHTAASVGWFGGAAVLLILLSGVVTGDLRPESAYPAAERVGAVLVVPLSLLSLGSGLCLAVGTHWGLFRHAWVAVKLVTTAAMATLVLLVLTPELRVAAEAGATLPVDEQGGLMIGPSVSCTLLLINVALSVYRPGRSRAARQAGKVRSRAALRPPA